MKARDYVKQELPGCYVFSPCAGKFVVKHAGVEIADRATSKTRAWVKAKVRLKAASSNSVDGRTLSTGD